MKVYAEMKVEMHDLIICVVIGNTHIEGGVTGVEGGMVALRVTL
jgi:hypothetical protein